MQRVSLARQTEGLVRVGLTHRPDGSSRVCDLLLISYSMGVVAESSASELAVAGGLSVAFGRLCPRHIVEGSESTSSVAQSIWRLW